MEEPSPGEPAEDDGEEEREDDDPHQKVERQGVRQVGEGRRTPEQHAPQDGGLPEGQDQECEREVHK